MKNITLAFVCCALLAQSQEIRVDLFDKHSRRSGYVIVDPRTGRVDQFDARGNRTGYGTTTPNPSGRGSELYDRNGRSISIDRRTR